MQENACAVNHGPNIVGELCPQPRFDVREDDVATGGNEVAVLVDDRSCVTLDSDVVRNGQLNPLVVMRPPSVVSPLDQSWPYTSAFGPAIRWSPTLRVTPHASSHVQSGIACLRVSFYAPSAN